MAKSPAGCKYTCCGRGRYGRYRRRRSLSARRRRAAHFASSPGACELEGQGMDLAFELGRQRLVDEAMPRQPRLAGKQRRDDQHAKVALAGARRAAMAGMQVRLVDDLEARRAETPASASRGSSTSRTWAHIFRPAMQDWLRYGPVQRSTAFAQRSSCAAPQACAHTEQAMKFDSKYFDSVRVKPDHEQGRARGGASLPMEGLHRRRPPPGAQRAWPRGPVSTCCASIMCASSTPPTTTSRA